MSRSASTEWYEMIVYLFINRLRDINKILKNIIWRTLTERVHILSRLYLYTMLCYYTVSYIYSDNRYECCTNHNNNYPMTNVQNLIVFLCLTRNTVVLIRRFTNKARTGVDTLHYMWESANFESSHEINSVEVSRPSRT